MKVWSRRFEGQIDRLMETYSSSIDVDRHLWQEDLAVNVAWAKALEKVGVLSSDELRQVRSGLEEIRREFKEGRFHVTPSDEDIHVAIERRLTELVGPAGAKIHTGRSRNDQVVTDLRLYEKKRGHELIENLATLQRTLVELAEKYLEIILPGYTHLQQAQPILLSHYLLSLFWALDRDKERLRDALKRADILPLGSGAIAGSAFPIDLEFLAKELGFSSPSPNSIDAVSDRDFIADFVYACALIMMHLSRYAEDFVLWSTREFDFIEIADAYATGSSMMPQKKNPDSLELLRGKAARVIADSVSLLTLLKGLPLTYVRDLQEAKSPFLDATDTTLDSVRLFTGVLQTITFKPESMAAKLDEAMLATDLADYLTKKGLPFRQSHEVVGQLVKHTLEEGIPLSQIPLPKLKEISPLFAEDVREIFDWKASVNRRNVFGGTGIEAVKRQLEAARQRL